VPIFEAGLTIYPVGDRRVANQVGTDPETEELELIAVRSPVIDAGMAR
jgi:hypothetical protein